MSDSEDGENEEVEEDVMEILEKGKIVDGSGKTCSLSDFSEKVVALYFSSSWSPQCREATKKLKRKYLEILKEGHQFEIIMIPYQEEDVRALEYFQSLPWKLLLDDGTVQNSLEELLGIEELPAMLILDQDRESLECTIDDFFTVPFDQLKDLDSYRAKCREIEDAMMTALPDTIQHSDHAHKLYKRLDPYGHTGFACDLCDLPISRSKFYNEGGTVSFHCEECNYDIHAVCATRDKYHQMKCTVPNIDLCIDCGERYLLRTVEKTVYNPTGTDYTCPNRCIHPPVSEISQRFLNLRGSNINAALPPWNRTLLHSAVAAGDPDLVWHLLKNGANPFLVDHQGASASSLAHDLWISVSKAETLSLDCSSKNQNSKLLARTKLIYQCLPKADDTSEPSLLPPPPLPKMIRGHSEGGIYLRSSLPEKLPILRGIPSHHQSTKRQLPLVPLSEIPPPIPISESKVVHSVGIPNLTRDTGNRLDRGTQQFTSLTLARLTSENESSLRSDFGNSWSETLQRLTLQELSREIIDINTFPTKSPELNPNAAFLFQCNGCLDDFPFSQLGFSCSHLGCFGSLCVQCLSRLAYVTITNALYAVPMLKCPLCRGRISTAVWSKALEKIEATPDEVLALKIVDRSSNEENLDQFLGELADFIGNSDFEENQPTELTDEQIISVSNLFVPLEKLFKSLHRGYGDILDTVTNGRTNVKTQKITLSGFVNILVTIRKQLLEAGISFPFESLFQLPRNELNEYFFGKIENQVFETSDSDLFIQSIAEIAVVLAVYLHRFYGEKIFHLVEEDEEDENSQTLGELLSDRYMCNADSLLKLLCGNCHDPVGLFYIERNGYLIPESIQDRQNALDEIIQPLPDVEKVSFLRIFSAYSSGSISATLLISTIHRAWCMVNLIPLSDGEIIMTESERDFFRRVLILLKDEERRLTAQLAFLRSFPKIWTPCCGTPHCFLCKVMGHHEGSTCDEVQEKEVGVETQYCPGCGVPTLRTEGCNHITCVCGMSWEWQGDEEENEDDEWEDVEEDD